MKYRYYCIEIAFAYCILWEKNVQNKVYNLNYHFIFVSSLFIILKLIKNYVIHYVKWRFFLIHIKLFVTQTIKALKLVCSVERVLNHLQLSSQITRKQNYICIYCSWQVKLYNPLDICNICCIKNSLII